MSARLCRRCQEPVPAERGPNARHCSNTCRTRWMNRRAWARKKYGEGDPPRICVGCRKAIDIMRGATSKYCSTDCRYRHKRRAWQEHDIPAAEIDRLFELEAARKRALRWRAA